MHLTHSEPDNSWSRFLDIWAWICTLRGERPVGGNPKEGEKTSVLEVELASVLVGSVPGTKKESLFVEAEDVLGKKGCRAIDG